MRILHILSGTLCSYVIYSNNAVISISGFNPPFINITEKEYEQLWNKNYVIIFGLDDQRPSDIKIYGKYPDKYIINKGIEILPNEFTLI
jgi:hypothetical protein